MTNGHPYFPLYTVRLEMKRHSSYQLFYTCTDSTYPTLVQTDIDLAKNSKSVKKTLTIPAWLNDRALAKGINFSQLLQEALVEKTM